MGGGLMQLVAYGAQDIYLTGNPQITFWKVVYRRHTNFAREEIEQTINGSSTLTSGNRGTVTVARNGDLLDGVSVVSTSDLNGLGDAAITDVEIQIGGQKIDKHTAEWLQVCAELMTPESKAVAYRAMTGVSGTQGTSGTGVYATHIPLQFWFCRNPGLALPLIALQYHEVKFIFNWGDANDGTAKVFCSYVYLDTDERRRFAQVSHEYLIEQLQYQTEGTSKSSYKLTYNHPVKELIWTDDGTLTTHTAKLRLNGHDRFVAREKEYFQLKQPMCHHTAVPGQNVPIVQTPELLAASEVVTAGKAPTGVAANNDFSVDATGGATSNEIVLRSATNPNINVGDLLSLTYTDIGGVVNIIVSVKTMTTQWSASNTDMKFEVDQTVTDSTAIAGSLRKLSSIKNALCRTSSMTRKINCYSFALEPEEHQPSGTCNFSRIDTAHLELSSAAQLENIYAVNYNVLRIMSGMGGLAYSN
jgi:hypothetical protein